ncbi:MAG: acyl-CoA thioesterase [Planctomycetota bacterium]|jgi:YbgC/YbaW family acyl-CoA thioester hydrolase
MDNRFVMHRRVEFFDTDMAGIVHFTAYFRYMESAEHELFRSLGLTITAPQAERKSGWPRVSCDFEFKDSLRFNEEFEVHISVFKIGASSVTYEAEIIRDKTLIAQGHSTSVYCELKPNGQMVSTDIPKDVIDKLRQYKRE